MAGTTTTFTLLSSVSLLAFLLPSLVRFVLRAVGASTRSRTSPRRELLLERANKEEAELVPGHKDGSKTGSDEDWEKIESSPASSSNGDRAADQWEGVIGFFHPFW